MNNKLNRDWRDSWYSFSPRELITLHNLLSDNIDRIANQRDKLGDMGIDDREPFNIKIRTLIDAAKVVDRLIRDFNAS